MRQSSGLALGVVLDLALWLALPAAFLWICVSSHLLPETAVLPHLRVVMIPLLGLLVLRLALCAAGLGRTASRLAAALAASALLTTMLAYYALVIVGLQSWGRVVSLELIRSYAPQLPLLLETLEIPLLAVSIAALAACLGVFAAAWFYFGRFDWTPALRSVPSRGLVPFILASAAAIALIEAYNLASAPPARDGEPVSLTFYPEEGASNFGGHAVEDVKTARLDAAEQLARQAYRPAAAAERRNLILIVVDALRPDHMGIYGYARDTTPHLARLERAGRLRKADALRASCANSFCGLLSMASSKFVHQMSRRPFTLQDALRQHGYRIHMILSGDHMGFYELRKAYGEIDEYFDARAARAIRYMNDDSIVLRRLAEYPAWDGTPIMLQFHLMSAHPLHNRDGEHAAFQPSANYWAHRDSTPDGRRSQRAVNYYDNGVLLADATIHAILEQLQRKGYLKNALVAITADHGEALGEHGYYMHANSVREEALRIPFVLVSYGRPLGRLHARPLGAQVDIAPTLLAELGMPRPSTWQGEALQQASSRELLPFQERWDMGVYDLRDPRRVLKYWLDIRGGDEYAFDLVSDPGEHVNLIDKLPAETRRELRRLVLSRGPSTAMPRPEDPR